MRKAGKWLLGAGCALALAGLIMLARGIVTAESTTDRLLCVCDGFSVSGVLFLCLGLMLWIAGEGSFDILAYAVKKGLHHILPIGGMESVESFYDYKKKKAERSEEKAPAGLRVLLVTGIVYLVIGLLFMAAWYRMMP